MKEKAVSKTNIQAAEVTKYLLMVNGDVEDKEKNN
jgi:hypothetical protein